MPNEGLGRIHRLDSDPINIRSGFRIYVDKGGHLSAGDIFNLKESAWREAQQPFLGIRVDPVWVEVQLANPLGTAQDLILRFAEPDLGEVSLYEHSKGVLSKRNSGIAVAPEKRDIYTRHVAFGLRVEAKQTKKFLIRIKTFHRVNLEYFITSEESFYKEMVVKDSIYKAVFYTILGIIFILNLLIYLKTRFRENLYYSSFILLSGLTLFNLDGYFDLFFWMEHTGLWKHHISSVINLLALGTLLYICSLINLAKAPALIRNTAYVLIAVLVIFFIFGLSPFYASIATIRANFISISMLFVVYMVFQYEHADKRMIAGKEIELPKSEKYLLTISLSCYLFGSFMSLLVSESLLPRNLFFENSLHIGCLFEIIFMFSGIGVRLKKIDQVEAELMAVSKEFDLITHFMKSAMSEERIKHILKNNLHLHFDPVYRSVTVMFIDMEAFSKVVNDRTEKDKNLLEDFVRFLNDIKYTVISYGGVVNKTLGDGLFCFFGFDLGGKTSDTPEIDAVKCGLEIQKKVTKALSEKKYGRILLPLRVGIHAGKVWIVDMDNKKIPDITLFGESAIFAQRLESACSRYKLCISDTVYESCRKYFMQDGIEYYPKYIKVKHHDELIKTYEVNPLKGFEWVKAKADDMVNASLGVVQKEDRIINNELSELKMLIEDEEFHIVNYSKSGFCVLGEKYIGEKIVLEATLLVNGEAILDQFKINPFMVMVRWGNKSDEVGLFKHGLEIEGLNEDQKAILWNILSECRAARNAS